MPGFGHFLRGDGSLNIRIAGKVTAHVRRTKRGNNGRNSTNS